MKKNILLLIAVALYSFLFYQQTPGLNFLLFSSSILGCFFYLDKEAFKDRGVQLISTGAIIASLATLYLGSWFAAWVVIITLFSLPGFILYRRSPVFMNLLLSIYSTLSAPVFMVINLIKAKKEGKAKNMLRILAIIIPLIFVFLFFFIYRNISPLFEKLTEDINFDFISAGFIWFTIGGFVLLYGLFYHKRLQKADDWEENRLTTIDQEKTTEPKWPEAPAFIFLFIALNFMLLLVNALDVHHLYLGAGMPEGITHKQFVHKGVGMLVLSIFLGISILLYFLRGRLNFVKNTKLIKILATLWMAQNAFMILSNIIRNTMYVNQALLTYKRIGVYVWLLVTLVGLVVFFIKLHKNRTTWFMIRYNLRVVFALFIVSSVVDWDGMIYSFNLDRIKKMENIASVDKNYLFSLSTGNVADLYSISNMKGFEVDSSYSYRPDRYSSNKNWLDHKLYDLYHEDFMTSWKSFSFRRSRVKKELLELYEQGKIKSLDLHGKGEKTLDLIKSFSKLEELNLKYSYFNDTIQLKTINDFPQLIKLNLGDNGIRELDILAENENLKVLELGENYIQNLDFLENFKNLDTLELYDNNIISLSSLPALEQLKDLSLDNNPLEDVTNLKKLKSLEVLSLSGLEKTIRGFPSSEKLRRLYMNNSRLSVLSSLDKKVYLPNLETLTISNNSLYYLHKLVGEKKTPNLKTLQINNNQFSNLKGVDSLKKLEYLDASANILKDISSLKNLTNIKTLYLGSNSFLRDINTLENLTQLESLSLYNNGSIDSFEAIQKLENLWYLNLSGTDFDSLPLISSYETLTDLHLSHCRIENWERLTKLKHLILLNASYITKEEVDVLASLPELKELRLSSTEERVIKLLKKKLKGVKITH